MKKRFLRQAFTLIELLVVISIIAVLATFAIPASMGVLVQVNQSKDMNNAKQIYLGLKLYAADNDGVFPATSGTDSINDANKAYQQICPRYVPQEKIFYVPKSVWTTKAPDELTSTGNCLVAGENAYAYVPGLNDTSTGAYPIVADAFTAAGNTDGTYTSDASVKGGVWKGEKAVVIRVDGSGKVEKLDSSFHVMGPTGQDSSTHNIFSAVAATSTSPAWLSGTITALNPL